MSYRSLVPTTPVIKARYGHVKKNIAQTLQALGRPSDSVRLIAVSKFQTVDAIRTLYQLGHRDFGENYVQELKQKREALQDLPDIRFSLIGHLQKNKVKDALSYADEIQSIDSLSLLETVIQKLQAKGQTSYPIWIQVKLDPKAEKTGLKPEELPILLKRIQGCREVELLGLMGMTPETSVASRRLIFQGIREIGARHVGGNTPFGLSIGMTDDYIIALEEGSTCLRIGSAIFGSRDKQET